MTTIEKEVSNGSIVTLDEKHFVRCEFSECQLVYAGGDFALTETKLHNCQFKFMGAAQRTVNLLASIGAVKPFGLGEPNPTTRTQ
jgi:hypothetical protein